MPVDFLTPDQKGNYAEFGSEIEKDILNRFFHLNELDKRFVQSRRSDDNRLGIALQLTSVRYLGAFISDFDKIPAEVLHYVSFQLFIENPKVLSIYSKREETRREHMTLIKEEYGYCNFDHPWTFRLGRFLYARSWIEYSYCYCLNGHLFFIKNKAKNTE